MGTLVQTLRVQQGVTFRFVLGLTNGPSDLSGFTAEMQVRSTVDDPAVLMDLTTVNGGLILNVGARQLTIYMTPTQTRAITWTEAEYDIELRGGGDEWRPMRGHIIVEPEVTR